MKTLRITVSYGELTTDASGTRSFACEMARCHEITPLSGDVLSEDMEPEAAFALHQALWVLRRDMEARRNEA